MATLWAGIAASGPIAQPETFDPLAVDDVLTAERAPMQYERRKSFIGSYAWAIPTPEAIQRIHEFVRPRTVLEICAGSGLWARLLVEMGTQVIATDLSPPAVAHFPTQPLEAEAAVSRYRECEALLVSWPPFKSECAYRALCTFEGDRLVYVGDVRFAADSQFHAALERGWLLAGTLGLPSWPALSDAVYLYKRKRQTSP